MAWLPLARIIAASFSQPTYFLLMNCSVYECHRTIECSLCRVIETYQLSKEHAAASFTVEAEYAGSFSMLVTILTK